MLGAQDFTEGEETLDDEVLKILNLRDTEETEGTQDYELHIGQFRTSGISLN